MTKEDAHTVWVCNGDDVANDQLHEHADGTLGLSRSRFHHPDQQGEQMRHTTPDGLSAALCVPMLSVLRQKALPTQWGPA